MLEVADLHVSYGPVHAVRGVSLAAEPERITLVLGANGAGKSTSLRAICGLQPASGGSVRLDGAELLGKRPHRIVRDGVSLVPEGRRIFAPLTVAENLRIGGYTADRSRVGALVDGVYDRFPILAQRRDMPAGLLSGGEQQMLAFGRALMAQPHVMLLDEPSMGLAPGMVDTVLAGVRAIADSGIGVLMVEQNVDAGLAVADTVSIVARGEVVRSGQAAELRQDASVVHALLGEAALAEEGAP
ncbi:ABC transporter ATP-binding protein [Prauserella rugosa]|uniref:Amino acid/amide ABC transporter ATP-binding protein 2 (HAAT family) n=1 Tax=Prauserella rugosa TaxID=43354 RepID=A0A660C817_9PSEU|nr:ABC transporter ATP-binding protein [Prauserella rugosa]KMS88157.1 ABC transporter ATP-binding protein [Streptomyces regensis]TWH19658.1 amino acid/amide ABC transporter ATP-binding protein 2 (HAAT family) [Prauserella rugosa]